MYVAELVFKVIADTSFDLAEQAIRRYIEALIFNGQVLGREFPTAWQQELFNSRVVLPAEDALRQQHHSPRGLLAMQQLSAAGLAYPQWELIGMDVMSPHSSPCHQPEFYIVYSRFSDSCSPVRCATHFAPVPLYQLPTRTQDHEPLIRWQLQYQALDEIQMQQQRVLRHTAERSLQQLHSKLNRAGRQQARQLEQSCKRPVYYALYSGSSKDCRTERDKPCPGCGKAWHLAMPVHDIFSFKCDQCRLLSNIAWDCQSPS